jgi:hypothetical protein
VSRKIEFKKFRLIFASRPLDDSIFVGENTSEEQMVKLSASLAGAGHLPCPSFLYSPKVDLA